MFRRKTSTPAVMSSASFSSPSQAGPDGGHDLGLRIARRGCRAIRHDDGSLVAALSHGCADRVPRIIVPPSSGNSIPKAGLKPQPRDGPGSPPAFPGMVTAMSYWKDKIVLVTGGSSGLGRVIADGFGGAGAKIVIAGLEGDAVQKAAAEMQAAGCDASGYPGRHHAAGRRRPALRGGDPALRQARRAGEQRRPLDARQGARHHARAVPRPDGTESHCPGALHAGGRAALAADARARRQHRLAGGQVGRRVGWGPIRPRSTPSPPIRSNSAWSWARRGCTSSWCVPGRSSARTRGSIPWKDWKTSPSVPGGRGRA